MSGSRTAVAKAEVVLLPTHKKLATHELIVHQALGRKIARLLGAGFGGLYDPAVHDASSVYFVPSDTLIGHEQHHHLHLRSEHDLFGGLVAEPFMATKAISHPLLDNADARPPGWTEAFHRQVAGAVLAGYSVFSRADARNAGQRLLDAGPIRIKPVLATAGRGQIEVTSLAQLDDAIDQPSDAAQHCHLEPIDLRREQFCGEQHRLRHRVGAKPPLNGILRLRAMPIF